MSSNHSSETSGPSVEHKSRLDIGLIKYFWQATPPYFSKDLSIPKFLKRIDILEEFTDIDLWHLTRFLHTRVFRQHEPIFKQGDSGQAFYMVLDGSVNIYIQSDCSENEENCVTESGSYGRKVTTIRRYGYLGELGLIMSNNIRNATAMANESSQLLAIYKPDLEDLFEEKPSLASKFLRALSQIIAERFLSATKDIDHLRSEIKHLESRLNE